MPGVPVSTGQFSKLLAPGLRKVYGDSVEKHEMEYDKIANMLSSKRNYEEELQVALLGSTPVKPQGGPTFFDQPLQGNVVRFTHVSYGLGFRVTREMWDDDLYGVMEKASRDLAKANAETIEAQFWSIFNLANTTTYTGFDGLSLGNAAHVLLGGGTYSNVSSGNAELSQAALQLMFDSFARTKNERNRVEPIKPWRIVIPPELLWVARAILQSPYITGTSTAPGNEINALREEGLTFFVCHYLTSAKFWHGLGRNHDIKYFWRKKATFENSDEFSTGDALYKTFLRFSQGFAYWKQYYGSYPV